MNQNLNLSEVFLKKGALKICNTFAGEHTCRNTSGGLLLIWNSVDLEREMKVEINLLYNNKMIVNSEEFQVVPLNKSKSDYSNIKTKNRKCES